MDILSSDIRYHLKYGLYIIRISHISNNLLFYHIYLLKVSIDKIFISLFHFKFCLFILFFIILAIYSLYILKLILMWQIYAAVIYHFTVNILDTKKQMDSNDD